MAQILLGIIVGIIIIIIIVFVIVIIVIVIIIIIIIIIIIQVGRLFSANCVVNVVQEYRMAKPARSHTSNNFTDFSRSKWAPSVTRVTPKVTRV